MKIIQAKTPNFNSRKPSNKITSVIIHHTQLKNSEQVYKIFESSASKVSSHYLIDRGGDVHQFVDENKKAWHAGVSTWGGVDGLNDTSIGIELDNNGEEEFSAPLMKSLIELTKAIVIKHNIDERLILGHSDIAYWRKVDPSHYFCWKTLADNSLGFFPTHSEKSPKTIFKLNGTHVQIPSIKEKLGKIGYKIFDYSSKIDQKTYSLLKAFKRRYDPKTYNEDVWDSQSQGRLEEILKRYDK